MKLVILTEGSITKGFGHITRTGSISDRIKENGFECVTVVDGDEAAEHNFADRGYIFDKWTNNSSAFKYFDDNDVVLIDSYHVLLSFLEEINNSSKCMIMIDDNKRLDYHDMIIINPNYFAHYIDYPTDKGNKYYLGKDYTLLRKEFYPSGLRVVNKRVNNVLITFGGTDVKGYTDKAIRQIKMNHKDVCLHVVATDAFSNLEEIKKSISDSDILYMGVSADEMADLMWKADFTISASGGTSNELIKMMCPSAQTAVADNQVNNINIMSKVGAFLAFSFDEPEAIEKLFDYDYRSEMVGLLGEFKSEVNASDLILSILEGNEVLW